MGRIIYQEQLFSKWITLLVSAVAFMLLWRLLEQLQLGSSGGGPVWLLVLMLILFILIAINFAWLTIRITDEEVVIAYGVIRNRIRWEQIDDCYVDEASAMWHGGYGIRLGWYKGKRRLIYNTMGDPRVVLLTRNSSTPEFVFSTAQPEDLVNRVREHLRSLKR